MRLISFKSLTNGSQKKWNLLGDVVIIGRWLHVWFWFHLWYQDLCTAPYYYTEASLGVWLLAKCATGACELMHWPLFWCYSSFCWRIFKKQSALSSIDHPRSTSAYVSMRDSCLKWFTLVTLVSIPGRNKGEKCQKWKAKKGRHRDCSNAYINRAEMAFSQVAFLSL